MQWRSYYEVKLRCQLKRSTKESEFELRRIADGEDGIPVIEVYRRSPSPADKPFWRIKDQFLRIASSDYQERRRALLENRHWFDCNQTTFESQVSSIVGIEDAAARIDQVQQWRIRSAEVYYRELRAKLARTKEFHLADLIPTSPEGLLSHFRLPAEKSSLDDFPGAWEQASRELIATEGLPDALDRITLFPIKTPKCLIDAIVDLPNNESHSLLLDWSKRCLSPLGKVHLADIAIRVGGIAADFLALARGAVSALYDEEAISQFNLLEAFLKFAHERFLQWRGAAGWSDATRLALIWAHSTRLQQIFNSLNADPKKLARILDSFTGGQSAAEVFYRDRTYSDVLHYHRFDRNVFLTHGVSAVLGSHGPEIARELDLKRRMEETAFSEERRESIIPLMRDPALMTNLTGSFLGGDHVAALSPIMGTDTDGLSSASLKNWISSVLDKSVSDHSTIEWGTIDLVVGDRPIYSDLSDGFWQLIESLDFLKLYKEDDIAALLALRVATDQIIYSDDDGFRARIEDTLLKLLRLSSKDLDTAKKLSLDKRVGALIDAALKLSIKLDNPQASSQRFSQLLHKMLNVSPAMAGYLGPGFVNLMFQLPAAQLHGMWPFLLTIRATSDKPL